MACATPHRRQNSLMRVAASVLYKRGISCRRDITRARSPNNFVVQLCQFAANSQFRGGKKLTAFIH